MAEVAYSSESITVLGGPSRVNVELDVGPQGNRGTFVFYGLENPNDENASFLDTPIVFDLYVVTDPRNEDYLQIFSYINQDGQFLWVPVLKLTPNVYSTNRVLVFQDGVADLKINLFELGLANVEYPSLVGTSAFFNVQSTISNINLADLEEPNFLPAMHSILVGDVEEDESDGQYKLPITINAVEFTGSAIQPIDDKSVIIYLSIIVVDPKYIYDFLGAQ
jgi:hypothetical protein